ncbi:MAG: hypothetical protein QM639_17385 [Rhodocyclaceae bacterium]
MHIVIMGWLFVAVMISIGADSVVAGVFRFIFWGLIPIGLMLYLFARRPTKGFHHPEHTARKDDAPD